jgi:hypothetical protein
MFGKRAGELPPKSNPGRILSFILVAQHLDVGTVAIFTLGKRQTISNTYAHGIANIPMFA